MSNKKYRSEEIAELQMNKYVKQCSKKYITYTDEFKLHCLEQNNLGVYHRDIFREAGFPDYIVSSEIPRRSLGSWKYKMKHQGMIGLVGNIKGRKKQERIDTSKMSKDEYIEYLEAQVASMKEVQVFLNRGKSP